MANLELQVVNSFRKSILELNKQFCPVEEIRLDIIVEEHFVERFLERFDPTIAPIFIKSVWRWIDKNYCILLFDAHTIEEPKMYRVELEHGTFAAVLFMNTLRVRTCFTGEEDA